MRSTDYINLIFSTVSISGFGWLPFLPLLYVQLLLKYFVVFRLHFDTESNSSKYVVKGFHVSDRISICSIFCIHAVRSTVKNTMYVTFFMGIVEFHQSYRDN